MDAFKLLSRSTSLQKSRPPPETQKPHLPSAGVSAHPQSLADDDLSPYSGAETRGKKRKRVSDGVKTKSKTSKGAADEPREDDAAQDAEERRRILKKHKLKVTLLESPAKQESQAAKAETKSQRKKRNNASIYPRPLAAFNELHTRCHVSQRLMDNLAEQGFYTATEVQMAALPILLGSNSDRGLGEKRKKSSRSLQPDLLTVAPTGSGKTLAFLVPVIQKLLDTQHSENSHEGSKSRYVRALILAPTHELVDQIVNEGKKLCTGTGIKVASMRKGSHIAQATGTSPAEHQSTIKADILVSTPMMLVNELGSGEGTASLDSIIHLVLDEADVLLDPLFREQTMAIWNACNSVDLRTSLWSATIGASIETLAREHITSRRKELHAKRSQPIFRLIVGLKDSSLPTIAHRLTYAATEQGKLLALRELLHPSTATASDGSAALRPPFIVFTQTIQRAKALFSELLYDIPPEAGGSQRIAVLHSELSESARSGVMAGFRKGEIWIIITTDLLSRGVDFRGVNGVVNYDIPNTGSAYVHRAGRTGRAGREGGVAVTLYTKEDIPYVKNIANVIAASEKAHGRAPQQGQPALDKWLLDSLPKVTKQARKDLKKRGVAVRRTMQKDKDTPKEVRKTRIGTKSGYDRKIENRRRGAKQGQQPAADEQSSGEDDGWEGLDG